MKLTWRNNSLSHLYPPPYTACIGGCDLTLLEMMQINLSSVKNVPDSRPQTNVTRQNSDTAIPNQTRPNIRPNNPGNTRQVRPTNPVNTGNPFSTARQVENVPRPALAQPRQFLPPPPVIRGHNATSGMPTPSSGTTDDNNVFCGCNQPAILLTVRKQNANQGK